MPGTESRTEPAPGAPPATGAAAADAEFLIQYMAEEPTDCPGCGHDLAGLTGAVCPRCAEELQVQVGVVAPKLGAFIAMLIGIGAGFGFNGLVLSWFVWTGLFRSRRGGSGEVGTVLLLIFFTVAFGSMGAAAMNRRRGFRRLGWWTRAALAVGAWVLSIASAILVFRGS